MEKTNSAYIELLKKVLSDYHRLSMPEYRPLYKEPGVKIKLLQLLDKILRTRNFAVCSINKIDEEMRMNGTGRPVYADTMVGMKRLNNVEFCIKEVIKNNIAGDFIELGVWRGGSVILMRALLKELNSTDRTVWVADSFAGLPPPDVLKYPADRGDKLSQFSELAISEEQVKHNFEKYGLLDDKVKFLKGWFKDTLTSAGIDKLAVLRLDGDMYESTMDGLVNLYPKLSIGGYIIIDDWGAIPACRKAVEDYRKQQNINEEIIEIDWTGVFWKKMK
ncbi:MAG TPA: TylF/MycF/NovP-related O-methyltransferase [Bacteroidia bacterium]|jgi:O-methyltransferase|nr:TylF/MycF/NovP-related O-methyltransferase [Bacteroidia bacterium]